MISVSLSKFLCVGGLLVVLSGEAFGQIYTESVAAGNGLNQSLRSYYMPKMIKIVHADGNAMIMRFDGDYWISMDDKKKEYWQVTFAEFEAKMKGMANKMDAAMQQMRQQMESMPPEQRRKMEQMMGPQVGGSPSAGQIAVKKTGQTRTIAGLPLHAL